MSFTTMSEFFAFYNTLQHFARLCMTLEHTAKHSNTLQHTAKHLCTLQHTFRCNTLQTLNRKILQYRMYLGDFSICSM